MERAAALLSRGRLDGAVIGALPAACRPADEAEAYLVQDRLHDRLSAAGLGPLAGHKIGCTTPVMQAFLSIHNPCAGGVLATTVHDARGRFRHADYRHVGVECEIAVRLAADLGPAGAPYSRDSVATAVGAVMAAIEVVDDRYDDYAALGAPTLIADDFFAAGCVLGPALGAWRALDLAGLRGRMTINGAEVGRGLAGDIMGHPLTALAWLANLFAARGKLLHAGEFLLLGSVVETEWVETGDIVEIEIERLGAARAHFN